MSTGSKVAIGCGVAFVLAVMCVGYGIWYAIQQGKTLLTDIGRNVAVQAIEDSPLTDEEKAGVVEQIDRVADAYKAGDIDTEQMGMVFTQLLESPVLVAGIVIAAEQQYVVPSGLNAEEKAQAKLDLQRFARGVFEESISPQDIEAAMAKIEDTDPTTGETTLKGNLTDEELRAFLADLRAAADAANIPNEPFEVDLVGELKKIVDGVLGE
jgi:hypothetical protein